VAMSASQELALLGDAPPLLKHRNTGESRMNRKLMGLVILALVSTLTVACTGSAAAGPTGGKSAGSAQAVEVKATDVFKFEPATITVKSGAPVRLTNLDGMKVDVETKSKASATTEFTPTAAGTYEFYCSVPGHHEAGMQGTLVVQ
jgi:plastocyanin